MYSSLLLLKIQKWGDMYKNGIKTTSNIQFSEVKIKTKTCHCPKPSRCKCIF